MPPVPGDLVRTCPYCGATPAPFVPKGGELHTAVHDGETRTWQVAACPACGGLVVFTVHPGHRLETMYPAAISEWNVEHLPASVESIWSEAGAVYRVGAYRSTVVACGRTLEQAADV